MTYTWREWLVRAQELNRAGYRTGVAESCPTCWRPIQSGGWSPNDCECGTEPLGGGNRLVELHGLGPIAHMFGSSSGRRAD